MTTALLLPDSEADALRSENHRLRNELQAARTAAEIRKHEVADLRAKVNRLAYGQAQKDVTAHEEALAWALDNPEHVIVTVARRDLPSMGPHVTHPIDITLDEALGDKFLFTIAQWVAEILNGGDVRTDDGRGRPKVKPELRCSGCPQILDASRGDDVLLLWCRTCREDTVRDEAGIDAEDLR